MNSKDVSRLQKIAQNLFFSTENIEDLELKRRQTSCPSCSVDDRQEADWERQAAVNIFKAENHIF